jgi:hypothetical protein
MSGGMKMLIPGTQGCLRNSIGMLALGAAAIALAFSLHLGAAEPHPAEADAAPVASLTPFVEVHSHFGGKDPAAAIEDALRVMPMENCAKVIFMPSPFAAEQTNRFDDEVIMAAEKDHRDKFAFLGGGGTLNVMIQQSVMSGDSGPEVVKMFKERAEQIMRDGASGFGEMTPEHFAMNANGFYEYAPADHPLFLALMDVSAEHDGAPISVHMEAVPTPMPIPAELASFHNNAPQLHANIPAFERLLSHNPHGNIVWAHEGWDNTGGRTVELSRRLLKAHPNLYMEIKIDPVEPGKNYILANAGSGAIKPEWLQLFKDFPDRFVIGSDQVYPEPKGQPQHWQSSVTLLNQLPADLRKKIAFENTARLYHFN